MKDEPEQKPENEQSQTDQAAGKPPLCTCVQDPFAFLPPEMRPRAVKTDTDLRKVTCPNCGLVYWTNRKTDLCIDCEDKNVKLPGTETKSGS